VTGVAGFIGSNFVQYYLNKYKNRRIIGLDKLTYAGNLENLKPVLKNNTVKEKIGKNPEDSFILKAIDHKPNAESSFIFIKGDICDSELVNEIFEKYEIDGIINFAAESHVDRSIHDPQIFLKTNILGTQVLLDAARERWTENGKSYMVNKNQNYNLPICRFKKFIQISTDEVYGTLGKEGYFTEKTPLDPHSPYSASKASADMIAKSYYDTFGLPVNITRCSNNYGPYQFPEKLVPLMINNALNHKELPVYGDGKQIRDWLYVEDHCRAIDEVFERGRTGEIYNIGGHNERENIFIVKKILEILREKTGDEKINENLIEHVKDRLGHDRRYGIDPAKIKDELGWEPAIMFEKGIEKTIDWYLNNKAWMEKVISGEYMRFYMENYGSVR
jgi:dTDP-glucose 4,6-dehydratase